MMGRWQAGPAAPVDAGSAGTTAKEMGAMWGVGTGQVTHPLWGVTRLRSYS